LIGWVKFLLSNCLQSVPSELSGTIGERENGILTVQEGTSGSEDDE
jgi:hypothetical protein